MGKRNRSSNKKDNIEVKGALNSTKFKQNPNWYFKDAVQAEILSRIQMNAFGALTKIGDKVAPTVCAIYANPCPGVVNIDRVYSPAGDPWDSQSKGINRAAQKLWYILTCKSGRAAGYTKADVAVLLLGMGAMIETYEFIRRAFGIAYTFNQRNRALPNMLYQAMGVDMVDYQSKAADYLKRMNSLMAIMNQLPIPGNVAWFAKCQDIYQNIYMDYPSEMAQLFVISPSTTWVVEENDGFIGGSYLRTVDMCVEHRVADASSTINIGITSGGNPVPVSSGYSVTSRTITGSFRTLSDYIDVFEEQINNLLFSSTFSQIYSDILRAFDNGTLSRWSFDYIDEKYNVAPVFDDNRLWMIHNASVSQGVLGLDRTTWQGQWTSTSSYDDVFKYGTPCNDVYQWGATDTLVYNPTLPYSVKPSEYGVKNKFNILDFPSDNPTTEERIEYTRYVFDCYNDAGQLPQVDNTSVAVPFYQYNINLPDHWFELMEILRGSGDPVEYVFDYKFSTAIAVSGSNGQPANIYGANTPVANGPDTCSKFHHGKLIRKVMYEPGTGNVWWQDGEVFGELNSWAKIDYSWFRDINDMIYVDLFDIR